MVDARCCDDQLVRPDYLVMAGGRKEASALSDHMELQHFLVAELELPGRSKMIEEIDAASDAQGAQNVTQNVQGRLDLYAGCIKKVRPLIVGRVPLVAS